MYEMTGAEIISHLLSRQGVSTISGIPGGANLPIYDALSRNSSITHILARHEQAAGFIAQGIARVQRRPAVCMATSGPGATNLMTAIADAKLDNVPLVCITGQVPTSMIGTDAFQEVDTYGMTIPITKHNFLVRDAHELLEVLPNAFRIAASGRTGPVLVDVPKDVQKQKISFKQWPAPGLPDPAPMCKETDLEAVVELLQASKRPVLCIGGGVLAADAGEVARMFAEHTGMPAVHTLMGLGALPSDHPLNLGMLGMHGSPYTNLVLEHCDLFFAVGMRFDDRATGKVSQFCPQAKILHADIDVSELGKIKKPHATIIGDAKRLLSKLTKRLPRQSYDSWLATVYQLQRERPLEISGIGDISTPYGLIAQVADIVPDDAIITTDVGQHQMWVAQAFPFTGHRRFFTSGGLGTMGLGLPMAIGAALAEPKRTIVCFSGDGSILMNIHELATAVENQVNVKIIVLNNNALGLVHQQQDLFYERRFYATTFQQAVDFTTIARGFGMAASELGNANASEAILRHSLQTPGPCLINAPIQLSEQVFPIVPPGAANKDLIGGKRHVA